jgi:threonine dehydratase
VKLYFPEFRESQLAFPIRAVIFKSPPCQKQDLRVSPASQIDGVLHEFFVHFVLTSLAYFIDSKKMKSLLEAIRPTCFIESEKLRRSLGLDLTIASETFQHTGSFKFRAAYNLALNVEQDEILTASSGNFGQALALACRLTGKKCTVVMPETSAAVKIEAVRNYGAAVDLVDTRKIGRNERVAQLAAQMPDAYFASAYDDLHVIEGNSTLGDEIAERDFDVVIAPIGGGGLSSGIVTGFNRNDTETKIIGAEPLLGNDAARSLKAGKIIVNELEPATIADGARTISLGNLNFEILRNGLEEIVEVSEDKIIEAVRLYFGLANLKVEPTGALSLGAVLEDPEKFADKKVCLVVSGGNVDAEVYKKILN